jgi:tetratricopeptide (TPR) repeat protein
MLVAGQSINDSYGPTIDPSASPIICSSSWMIRSGAAAGRFRDRRLLLSPSPDRYALHDLLRVYAAEKADRELDEPERTAAITRLVTWYTEAAVAADVLLMPRRWRYTPDPVAGIPRPPELSSAAEAADWADREHANLVAAVCHAHGSGLHRLAWQLPTALFSFSHLRRHLDSWLSTYRTALASALESQDEAAPAVIRGNLSVAYILMGRPHEATELLHASLRFWQARGHDERAAGVLNNLGIAAFEMARPDYAVGYLRQSMAVYQASGNTYSEAGCHGNIGQIHLRLGDYSHAVEAYDAAEGLYRRLSDISAGLSEVLESQAEVRHALGRTAAAQAGLEEAVTIHRVLGDRHGLARTLELLGDIRRERTDSEGAVRAWSESASILGGTDEARTSKLLAKIEKEAGSRHRPTGRPIGWSSSGPSGSD